MFDRKVRQTFQRSLKLLAANRWFKSNKRFRLQIAYIRGSRRCCCSAVHRVKSAVNDASPRNNAASVDLLLTETTKEPEARNLSSPIFCVKRGICQESLKPEKSSTSSVI
ncbi:hypothetical protein ACLOJK_017786 [Asimina triloba]